MVALTFETLARSNKRKSLALLAGLTLLLGIVCAGFSLSFGSAITPALMMDSLRVGFIFGIVAGIIGAFISYFLGAGIILTITGATLVSKGEDPELINIVEEMALAAGIPVPKVYAVLDESPNAFASVSCSCLA